MPLHSNRLLSQRLWDAIASADEPELRTLIASKAVWRMYGRGPLAGSYKGIDAILHFMANVGERADELESSLIEIFASESGAVLRYSVRARRGSRSLEIEHLFMIQIRQGEVIEGVFAPLDQHRYDEFWLDPLREVGS
jgi:ketosteroid isomerase-like protein